MELLMVFQAEDGIRDHAQSRGLGDVYKRQIRNSLGIPDTSLMLEGNKAYVYKVDDSNTAIKQEIKIGIRDSGYVEVISGLNEGDIIVAEGLKKVRPRGKIKPIER